MPNPDFSEFRTAIKTLIIAMNYFVSDAPWIDPTTA